MMHALGYADPPPPSWQPQRAKWDAQISPPHPSQAPSSRQPIHQKAWSDGAVGHHVSLTH
ncbi:hypothetical protein B0T14DRAFT_514483 [Immersiella caudata]|uniref:Uncharacterized protein n=1 Tax=Immersiella caudata TaxID=314043 RepID=A0AA40C2N2_9PEZI|nr:hypothetical protein B0T14DRAFT_514483 [Immersiella caudata]